MSFPGGNLYAMARRLIPGSAYTFFAADPRPADTDARGLWQTTYPVTGVALNDSIQSVPQQLYAALGLDLEREYIMIYTDNALLVTRRDATGDQIEFPVSSGIRWQLEEANNWTPIDSWRGVLAVRLQATTPP